MPLPKYATHHSDSILKKGVVEYLSLEIICLLYRFADQIWKIEMHSSIERIFLGVAVVNGIYQVLDGIDILDIGGRLTNINWVGLDEQILFFGIVMVDEYALDTVFDNSPVEVLV